MTNRTCTVPECDKPARSAKADWCKMHYHRWYRHGSTDKVARGISTSQGRRYKSVYEPDHPLASVNGKVYEHRRVLFGILGFGDHACHWCGTTVRWATKGDPDELQPDHLNGDGADNRPENLVPSCRRCNTARGTQERHDALKAIGFWSHNDTIDACEAQRRKPRVA